MKKMLGLGLLLVAIGSLSAFGDGEFGNSLVRFDGRIGVDPISNVTVNRTTTIL
jgi:hypothetical protein